MMRHFRPAAYFLLRVFTPDRQRIERRYLEDNRDVIRWGLIIGVAIYTTSSALGSLLYSAVAFAGVLALSWWGEPRPAATAGWAAVAMFACATFIVLLGLVVVLVLLLIGALT